MYCLTSVCLEAPAAHHIAHLMQDMTHDLMTSQGSHTSHGSFAMICIRSANASARAGDPAEDSFVGRRLTAMIGPVTTNVPLIDGSFYSLVLE